MTARLPLILVADDDASARLLMQATLVQSGFEVDLAEDGEDALRQFGERSYDMVMLDVNMPDLDGYEVCVRLRRVAGMELPIVMVTGLDDLDSVERAFESGATDFIAKPINWPLFCHRMRYLYRSSQFVLALHAANARNSAMLSALPDAIVRLDADCRVIELRRATHDADGHSLPGLGQYFTHHMPEAMAERFMNAVRHAKEIGECAELEYEVPDIGGMHKHYEARLATMPDGGLLCLVRDITERKEAERSIHRLAYYDTLTGLPNRLLFAERLALEIERTRRRESRLAVLFLDLDGFKNANDTLGHGAGDLLLQWVADRLRTSVRTADIVARDANAEAEVELARLGGDEFTLLVPELNDPENALAVAYRIHESMRRPFLIDGREVVLTASIGIAVYPDDGADVDTLLKHADTAMYHAKDLGRDNCQFYSASLTREAARRLEMDSSLRQALEREEFTLVYQPQLDLASGRILSLEALIRWNHPERGLVPPMEFIPVAEENGLIVPIGEWVLLMAGLDAATWHRQGMDIKVAINLSAAQFKSPELIAQIRDILADTALPPGLLEFEVTEGVLMEDTHTTMATLTSLRDTGARLSLDDFGTGYSSLSYLKRLPLNNIKIDQSFVRGLPEDKENLSICRAIVALARNLGFTLTAEGVESPGQARILRDMGCDTLQGFYIGPPVAAESVPDLLMRRRTLEETP